MRDADKKKEAEHQKKFDSQAKANQEPEEIIVTTQSSGHEMFGDPFENIEKMHEAADNIDPGQAQVLNRDTKKDGFISQLPGKMCENYFHKSDVGLCCEERRDPTNR